MPIRNIFQDQVDEVTPAPCSSFTVSPPADAAGSLAVAVWAVVALMAVVGLIMN